MSKYLRLHPSTTIENSKFSKGAKHKDQPFHMKTFLMKVLIILCLAVVSGITIMAFLSNEVLFESLLAGLFIIGCVLFIKGINNEKANIQRTKRNINH